MSYDPNAVNVWFVNVGHGDSTIVRFPSGRVMMVDINNSKSLDAESRAEILEAIGMPAGRKLLLDLGIATLTAAEKTAVDRYESLLEDPIGVLKQRVFQSTGGHVFRFIATHPDLDHLSGLYRLAFEEPTISMGCFWDTENTKVMTDDDLKSEEDKKNWLAYKYLGDRSKEPATIINYREDRGNYWTPDGISILSSTRTIVQEANNTEDWNHLSYVLHIQFGSSSLILPGDASVEAQQELAQLYGDSLGSLVLKAPHHGRESGYCEDFVKRVYPDYTIVSVGKKPDSDASTKYKKYTRERVLSTRMQGTMHLRMHQDGSLELYDYRNERLDLNEDLKKEAAAAALRRGLRGW